MAETQKEHFESSYRRQEDFSSPQGKHNIEDERTNYKKNNEETPSRHN